MSIRVSWLCSNQLHFYWFKLIYSLGYYVLLMSFVSFSVFLFISIFVSLTQLLSFLLISAKDVFTLLSMSLKCVLYKEHVVRTCFLFILTVFVFDGGFSLFTWNVDAVRQYLVICFVCPFCMFFFFFCSFPALLLKANSSIFVISVFAVFCSFLKYI